MVSADEAKVMISFSLTHKCNWTTKANTIRSIAEDLTDKSQNISELGLVTIKIILIVNFLKIND